MPTDFVAILPPQWVKHARSFLVRAAEFQQRNPLVSYFLKTHVAYVCLKHRSPNNKEETAFIMTLLGALEHEKIALKSELDKNDGRTVLTKAALMLFTKADDMERNGIATDAVVKMFYTSSVLFEATGQYLEGTLDPLAKEKCRYAQFVAAKMKKALDSGLPYQSHNADEAFGMPEETGSATQPQSSHAALPPPSAPPVQPPAPQPQPPPMAPPTAFVALQQPAPTAAPLVPPQPQTAHAPPAFSPPPTPSTTSSATLGAPSMDAMIDAQKLCKNAVSALQFYDHQNARKQLLAALRLLDGS